MKSIMERIFVSYKRDNKEKVFSIVNNIESQLGIKCWIDLNGIESSAQFGSVICKAIDTAEVVLFMHSSIHQSIDFENDWTIKELNYAQSKRKKVVLVKLDKTPLDNIFLLEYGSKNNIDANDPKQFQNLLKDLHHWLKLPEKPHLQPNTNNISPHSTEKKTPTSVPPAKVAKATPKVTPSEKPQITDEERVKLYRSLGMTNAADELERKMKREKQWWSKPYNVMNDFLMVPITNYLLAYTVLTIMVIYHLSVGSCFGFMISGFDIVMAVIFSLVGIYCSLKMGIITDDSEEIKNIWMGILSFLIIPVFSPFWGIVIGGIAGCVVDWWLHWQDLHATYLIYIYIVILVFSLYTLTHTLIKRRKEKTGSVSKLC